MWHFEGGTIYAGFKLLPQLQTYPFTPWCQGCNSANHTSALPAAFCWALSLGALEGDLGGRRGKGSCSLWFSCCSPMPPSKWPCMLAAVMDSSFQLLPILQGQLQYKLQRHQYPLGNFTFSEPGSQLPGDLLPSSQALLATGWWSFFWMMGLCLAQSSKLLGSNRTTCVVFFLKVTGNISRKEVSVCSKC